MIIYLLATALSCALTHYAQAQFSLPVKRLSSRREWLWLILCALPLSMVSALRWGVGTDFLITYLPEYRALLYLRQGGDEFLREQLFAPLGPLLAPWGLPSRPEEILPYYTGVLSCCEPGFRALMELDAAVGLGFRGVVFLTSLAIGLCIFYVIFTESRMPVLAVYFYVATSSYFVGMNVVRQYIAVAIGLVALRFLEEKRLLPYCLCVAAGMLFHTSAILLLPCYFVCRWRVRPRLGFALVAAVWLGSRPLARLAVWLMPRMGLGYYARYIGSAWDGEGFEWILFAVNLCVLLFAGFYWERCKEGHPIFVVWYNLLILGTCGLALSGVLPLMKRVNYYYGAPLFLLMAELFSQENNPKIRRVLLAGCVLLFAAETFVAVGLMNKNGCLPYRISAWC